MALIDVPYDRRFTDSDVVAIIARATNTLNVLHQLGSPYQSLPGFEMAAYQTQADALETDVTALKALVDQTKSLLLSIDDKTGPLDGKNKGALPMLRGILAGKAQVGLLDQITGPQSSGGGSQPTPPPPPNP